MEMDVGKHRGRELSELSPGYLEWALGHLALSDEMAQGVLAEHARRRNAARAEAETPAARALGRVGRPVNRLAARLHARFLLWRRGTRSTEAAPNS